MGAIIIDAVPVLDDGSITGNMLADGAVTTPKLAAAAVTAAKLAQSAVELTADTVTGELPGAKLAAGAVTEPKIADEAVGLSKCKKLVRLVPISRNVNEVSAVGVVETEVKTFTFSKKNNSDYDTCAIIAELKADSGTAYLKAYFDSEPTTRATLSAASTSYDLQESTDIDISDLGNGTHVVHLKLYASAAGVEVHNKLVELFGVKATA